MSGAVRVEEFKKRLELWKEVIEKYRVEGSRENAVNPAHIRRCVLLADG